MSSSNNTNNGTSRSNSNKLVPTTATPGSGWSNGDIPPLLYPVTQDGRLRLYGSQRRWIALQEEQGGWTRIDGGNGNGADGDGAGADGKKKSELLSKSDDDDDDDRQAQCARALIAQLCEKFYHLGWNPGTGGGVSIRVPRLNNPGSNSSLSSLAFRVFVAPSGIQKEDMIGDDVFELDMHSHVVVPPKMANLRQSACTPLWFVVYQERPTAMCVIHTHSIHAQMATLLDPTESAEYLEMTHLEMLKGVGQHGYDDVLRIPIIDNRPTEDLLEDQLRDAIRQYPKSNAVLVRRHGVYVWGDSWQQAKTQCESFDYLFHTAVQMKAMGLNPATKPMLSSGTSFRSAEEQHVSKKLKISDDKTAAAAASSNSNGFNGLAAIANVADLDRARHAHAVAAAVTASSSSTFLLYVPLLPRDAKCLVLDIEGCTTSIAFVNDVLFPYVRRHLQAFLETNKGGDALVALNRGLAAEVKQAAETSQLDKDKLTTANNLLQAIQPENAGDIATSLILVEYLMDRDLKTATLKDLQGEMWKSGYESGDLTGHVYPDFKPMLDWMKKSCNVSVFIYSSGSIAAQKLLFGHSSAGNLLPLLTGHYDIRTAGNKKEAVSYSKIIQDITTTSTSTSTTTTPLTAKDIVFVSDSEAELCAATEAGIGHAIMSIRPGNAAITDEGRRTFPTIHSLLQLCGSMD